MLPSFDLTIWSEWASLAGFLLSIWVLIQTYRVGQAVRTTESAIYRRLSLPDRIEKIDAIRKAIHSQALVSDFPKTVEARELLGKVDAITRQLRDIPDPGIRDCLERMGDNRYRRKLFWKIKQPLTQNLMLDICEQLSELRDLLKEYKSQGDILGRRQ